MPADAKRVGQRSGCFPVSNGRDPRIKGEHETFLSGKGNQPLQVGQFTAQETPFGSIYASNGEVVQETGRASGYRQGASVLSTSAHCYVSSDIENSFQEFGTRSVSRNSSGHNSVHFEVVQIPTSISQQQLSTQPSAPKVQSIESSPRRSTSGASLNGSFSPITTENPKADESSQSSSPRLTQPRSDDDDSFIDDMLAGMFKTEEFEQFDINPADDFFADFDIFEDKPKPLSSPSDKRTDVSSVQEPENVKHERRDTQADKPDELCTLKLQKKTRAHADSEAERNSRTSNGFEKCASVKAEKPVASIKPQVSSVLSGDLGSAVQNQNFKNMDVKNCKIITPLNSKIIHGSDGQVYLYVPE